MRIDVSESGIFKPTLQELISLSCEFTRCFQQISALKQQLHFTEVQNCFSLFHIFILTFLFLKCVFASVQELSLCHKLCFSKPYTFGFQSRRPQIFQTMNSVRSNNISLKYQRFATLGYKDIGIIKSEFVAKTQFLCLAESF